MGVGDRFRERSAFSCFATWSRERPSREVCYLPSLFLTITHVARPPADSLQMEEGTKSKRTVFVGGIGDDVDESVIYENFSTFGE